MIQSVLKFLNIQAAQKAAKAITLGRKMVIWLKFFKQGQKIAK